MGVVRMSFLAVGIALVACPVAAEEEWTEEFLARDRLLGDWGGAREWFEENGVDVDLTYIGEAFWNTHGGMNTHHSGEYMGLMTLSVELDTESAGWWENGMFFLQLQEAHGRGITGEHVGDFQTLSNIDADDFKQVSEIWYRHVFLDESLWVKLGKMEANEDFAYVDFGGEFINSSGGYGPTIPLVTYPDQDWGVVWGAQPVDWFSVQVGVYQGRPNGGRSICSTLDDLYGPMVMVEPAFHYTLAEQPGHFRVGGWWNGDRCAEQEKHRPTRGLFRESYGWYLTWDQEVWRENPEEDEQGLGLFAQYGWAPEDRTEAARYVGGGVQWVGAVPSRDEDVLGLAAFHVEFSDEVDLEDGGETAIELFYKLQATGWMSLKPDVQYITNPGGLGNDDALAAGVRWEVAF